MILRDIPHTSVEDYFAELKKRTAEQYKIAIEARKKMLDPSKEVEILLATELAGRVESLVSIALPKLSGSGLRNRILELEKELGKGNDEVGFVIASEVTDGKFIKFENDEKAIEAGMRVGTAYWTLGVTTAPLEGLAHVKLKKRTDGEKYLSLYFSGPIRSAGGTTNAMIVMLGDFLRKKFDIKTYDPTPQEVERYFLELETYHNRVTRLQYFPSADEVRFLIKHLPVEVNGEATEDKEVLAYKDLPRVETNRIRGGMCLTISMMALKAAKILKRVRKYGVKYKLENWLWLEQLLETKQKVHKKATAAIYIAEIPGGRPVFGYPNRIGAFRLRYGKTRNLGLAAIGLHPATMIILDEFIAVGTQLKTELPGKAGAVSPVDSIEGPIVRLKNGNVVKVTNVEQAKELKNKVEKIFYAGDVLIGWGEFLTNGHKLEKGAWCEEWWREEVRAKKPFNKLHVSFDEAVKISKDLNIPLHPDYTYFWESISGEDVLKLKMNLNKLNEVKSILEILGVEHTFENEKVVLSELDTKILQFVFSKKGELKKSGIETINTFSPITIRRKAGRYLGTRMGRPEKAERRLLKGKPHTLFPAGRIERLRNIPQALKMGLRADLSLRVCPKCSRKTYYLICDKCGVEAIQKRVCIKCGATGSFTEHCGMRTKASIMTSVSENISEIARKLEVPLPTLVKGVRGMSSDLKIPERLEKGILRSKYELNVNKDGTIRFDSTDMPLTHFKPKEIGVPIERLKELGYLLDMNGKKLENEDQLLELKVQDILLSDNKHFSSSKYLINTCKFVDDLLVKFYGLSPFYNVKRREDLVGQLIIGLAPHTSAGILGRIIGFSEIRSGYAHPAWHAAKKRNCDGDEDSVIMLLDALLNFSREFLPTTRGGKTMDVPLVITTELDLEEVDDEVLDMDVVDTYPLALYEAAEKEEMPWKVPIINLGKWKKREGLKFTHKTSDIAAGPTLTAYKTLGSMINKVKGQLLIGEKLIAVDEDNVAEKILSTHFLKDIKGNLRQYSNQQVRCVKCNTKFRRFPLLGKCDRCGGKIILTVHEGTIKKYLEASIKLAEKYNVSAYIKSQLNLLEKKLELAFGIKEKQEELDQWLN